MEDFSELIVTTDERFSDEEESDEDEDDKDDEDDKGHNAPQKVPESGTSIKLPVPENVQNVQTFSISSRLGINPVPSSGENSFKITFSIYIYFLTTV